LIEGAASGTKDVNSRDEADVIADTDKPADTDGADSDERPFDATLTHNMFVSRTEITQRQWRAASGGVNPSCFQTTSGTSCSNGNANADGPVENIDWYSALAFANRLSTLSGLTPCYSPLNCTEATTGWADGIISGCTSASFVGYSCNGYRILTESEWEYSARAGTSSAYFWGDSDAPEFSETYTWYAMNSGTRSQPVGRKLVNAFGLADMSGNVAEWVWDRVGTNSGVSSYLPGRSTNYTGLVSGSLRGVRGGSFLNSPEALRSASRGGAVPAQRSSEVGFRVARTVF